MGEDLKEGIALTFSFSQFNFVILKISILFFSFTHSHSFYVFCFSSSFGPFLTFFLSFLFLVPLELNMEELPLAWGGGKKN